MCADSFKSYASADVKPTLHAVGFSRPYAGDAPNAGVGPVNSMLLTSLLMPLSGSNFGWYIVPFSPNPNIVIPHSVFCHLQIEFKAKTSLGKTEACFNVAPKSRTRTNIANENIELI